MDRFETRTSGKVVSRRMPVTTWLRDRYFPEVETFTTKKIEMTTRKGAYEVAPFVAPYVDGIIIERDGYEVKEYDPPTIAPKRPLTPEHLQVPAAGENVYSLRTPEERQQEIIDRDLQDLSDSIDRREELMVSNTLCDGQIIAKGYFDSNLEDYKEQSIVYGFGNKVTKSGSAAWNLETSTKYKDIEDGVNKLREAGYNPRDLVMGSQAWQDLRDDPDFAEKISKDRLNLINLSPQPQLQNGNGVIYMGDIKELSLEIWVYHGFYKAEDGSVKPYIPVDHVLIMPGPVGDIAYGAVTHLVQTDFNKFQYETFEGTRIPRQKGNTDNDVMEMILSSKPIPRPYDLLSWYVIDTRG